jgi:hypothetical protein
MYRPMLWNWLRRDCLQPHDAGLRIKPRTIDNS